jgi:LmbE family N-acetylglucosaminyl deacetylase
LNWITNKSRIYHYCVMFITFIFTINLNVVAASSANSAQIYQHLKKLNVLGSVLYIAAHPDDENTAVLAYMAQGKLVRTAYLSLTRGDGGQNLLGNEKGALLGVIRTQELLSARRIDGGEQFFSRAIDFGYSKTAKETLNKWDREQILADIVRVIRKFRPSIIITRFSETNGGHGHHLVSAILAKEAFYAAADPTRFPEQLHELQTWQAKRLLWNTWRPTPYAQSIDIGEYNPILGQSYGEFASASRSMHKSQGFGVGVSRGSQLVYFDHTAGDSADSDLFDDIDLTWKQVPGAIKIQENIKGIIKKYAPETPSAIVPDLVTLYQHLDKLNGYHWIAIKKNEIQELILMCTGLWMEAVVWEAGVSPGTDIIARSTALNRSNVPIILHDVHITYLTGDSLLMKNLDQNKPFTFKQKIHIPNNTPYTQPLWLENPNNGKMFTLSDPHHIDFAETSPALLAGFNLEISGQTFKYVRPVQYHRTDAVKGEEFRSFIIQPELSLSIEGSTYIFTGNNTREIRATLKTNKKQLHGQSYLSVPQGWNVDPTNIPFELQEAGDQKTLIFRVTPNSNSVNGTAVLKATAGGKDYDRKMIDIVYDHISSQTVLQPASAQLVKIDLTVLPGRIGYIMGSGDETPEALKQLGYEVELLGNEELDNGDLSSYNAIVCGIRAFNTRKELEHQQKRLIQYVEDGGTWIVQHNTRFGRQVKQIGPYPFNASGKDRIAEENAPIKILIPDHTLMNYPNKITEKDFDHWVQERGAYLAESWEGKLFPLIAGNDQGEPAKLGGLLYSRYGKGVFIYTAFSWFRQLPAGVPGAYRLFVNLISAKGK